MKRGGVLLALVVLVALGALVWRELARDENSGVMRPGDLVFPYNAARVQEFTVTLRDETATMQRDASGAFQVVSGSESAVVEKAGDFLSAVSRARFIDVVQESVSPEDLARYGLRPPALAVKVTLRPPRHEGETMPRGPLALEVGGISPVQPGLYGRVNQFERVVLLGPEAADLIDGVGRELFGHESLIQEAPREPGMKPVPSATPTPHPH